MKDQTAEYIAKEEETKRKPAELYHFWRGDGDQLNINTWYYTSGDVAVDDGVNLYIPATISRSQVKYNSQLEVTTMDINIGHLENPILEYIAINPIEIIWVSVMKMLRDLSPFEVSVVFLGQIKNVSFKGNVAVAQCVGFEYFLNMPIPLWRYQITCNHKLFDEGCNGVDLLMDKATFKVTAVNMTLDATGTLLTNAIFDTFDDGYFIWGSVEFGDEKRTVVAHVGSVITLAYKMRDLVSGDTVYAYPGCDGRPETCRDKFVNVNNGLWFPFIPEENPAIRTP